MQQKYFMWFHILFNAFHPLADGKGPGRGTTVALVKRTVGTSLAAETGTRTITGSVAARETAIASETVTARETENVKGNIATVSWRGRCVSCLFLCLSVCLSPLFLQDSDVLASYPAESGISQVGDRKRWAFDPTMWQSTVIFPTANLFFFFSLFYFMYVAWSEYSDPLNLCTGHEAIYCTISAPETINCPALL